MAKRARSKPSTSTGPATLNPAPAKAGGMKKTGKRGATVLRTPTGTMTRKSMRASMKVTPESAGHSTKGAAPNISRNLNPTAAQAGGKRVPTKTAQQLLATTMKGSPRARMTPSTNLTQIKATS